MINTFFVYAIKIKTSMVLWEKRYSNGDAISITRILKSDKHEILGVDIILPP
jgi:hypothetical protein